MTKAIRLETVVDASQGSCQEDVQTILSYPTASVLPPQGRTLIPCTSRGKSIGSPISV